MSDSASSGTHLESSGTGTDLESKSDMPTTKNKRAPCLAARDRYWNCYMDNNGNTESCKIYLG